MALTKDLMLGAYGNLTLPAAYIRITSARTYKGVLPVSEPTPQTEIQLVDYSYAIYLDAQARQDGKNPLDTGMAQFEWDEEAQPNVLMACYAHLKAQETYAEATDC